MLILCYSYMLVNVNIHSQRDGSLLYQYYLDCQSSTHGDDG